MSVVAGSREGAPAGFSPEADGARWKYVGPLTFANASVVFAAAATLRLPTTGEVDLAGVAAVDSSSVAVLVALKRRAAEEKKPLQFISTPAALVALANLYGVEDMLVA